ncbi:MAG: DUF2848 domain-containing protein [Pseudomonadota bacterium]
MKFSTEKGPIDVTIRRVIVAGWTGRDAAAVQHHIEELAAIGVPAPSQTPLHYHVSASLLTFSDRIDVLGTETSGEAEPLIIKWRDRHYIGLASDHTDRGLESVSVAHSKQICAKPVAENLWLLNSVRDTDQLVLSSWIKEGGEWITYQTGTLAAIRPLAELIADADLQDGDALLCGTLPAIAGVRPAASFRMSLTDEATGKTIKHEYQTHALTVSA